MKVVTLATAARTPGGSSTARRDRRAGRLPAVVYGEGAAPAHLTLDSHEFQVAIDHGARVIDLSGLDTSDVRVLLKDVQFDAFGTRPLHADFVRVNPDKELTLRIPLELTGVPKGLSLGGVLSVIDRSLEVSCLPKDIPEILEIDVSGLGLGDSIHAREVVLPAGVTCAADPDSQLVTVAIPRGVDEEAPAAEGEGEGAEAAPAEGGAADEDNG